MKLLVIGGTRFVGRALVETALERGHDVTLFHRGRTNPDLFPNATHIHGDRDGGLSVLGDARYDAALDTCGYVPRIVRASAEYLADKVDRYVFISTVSVYEDTGEADRAEDAPLSTMEDHTIEEINGETYGPLKVLCEEVLHEVFNRRALIVRPGIIVGPHDPTNRFTYWVRRIREGEQVLAPGQPDRPVQVIDTRDLATWTIQQVEKRATGTYNAVGGVEPYQFAEMLQACIDGTDSDAELVWADDDFLEAQTVQPFTELPLWLPGNDMHSVFTINNARAIEAGLTFRPLEEIVRDTLAWVDAYEGELPGKAGISREREAELLALLANRD